MATKVVVSPVVLPSLLAAALLVRLALAPLTEGWDFHAYHQLVNMILRGQDVYSLKRSQVPAAWAYFPLCLNLFTAFGWLAQHTGLPFRVLAKLPVLTADLGIGWLLYSGLCARGHSQRRALVGMCMYLFNPLVLYNGAVVGRFDAIALLFLFVALESYRNVLFVPAYALAIAAKTFPLFVLPLLALGRDRQPLRRLALACLLVLPLSMPYIVTDWRGLLANLLYDTHGQDFGRLSWYWFLELHRWLSHGQLVTLAHGGALLYPLLLLTLINRPVYVKVAVGLALFLALNRSVYEQYLLWPLPFLILVGLHYRDRLALWLVAALTVAGVLENEQTWAPLDHHLRYRLVPVPWAPLNLALAVLILAYVLWTVRSRVVSETPAPPPRPPWARRG